MARAYAYCENDEPIPGCVLTGRAIEKYGVESVTGEKIIRVRLHRDITMANNVINSYESRKQSDDWVKWVTENPDMNSLLEQARHEWQMLVSP
jgi:hypothetical protein